MTEIVMIYAICALFLTVYGINTHILVHLFRRRYPRRMVNDRNFLDAFYGGHFPCYVMTDIAGNLPTVTIQLPVYNELNVVERLIDAVAAFQYPDGRNEIHVLDDSTDETRNIVAEKVRILQKQGIDIHHITRDDRTGFKA